MKFSLDQITNKVSKQAYIVWILFILYFSYFLYNVISCSINFPFNDDYSSILEYLIDINTNSQPLLTSLFKQHNEHRIFLNRLITLIYFTITQNINFISLIIIGNLFIVGIYYFIINHTKSLKNENKLILTIPAIFIIINFQYWEIAMWAMASIQNIGVLLMAIITLSCFFHKNNYIVLVSYPLLFITTFTSGNGMMTFLAGLIVAILIKLNKKTIYLWTISGLTSVFIYFYSFQKPNNTNDIKEHIINNFTDIILYGFTFIGNYFQSIHSVTFGITICVLLVLLTVKKSYIKNPTLFSFILFIILTAIPITIARSINGIEQANSSRYVINSSILVATIYLLSIDTLKINSTFKLIIVSCTLILCSFISLRSLNNIPNLLNNKLTFHENYIKHINNEQSNHYYFSTIPLEYSSKVLDNAKKISIYNYDDQYQHK